MGAVSEKPDDIRAAMREAQDDYEADMRRVTRAVIDPADLRKLADLYSEPRVNQLAAANALRQAADEIEALRAELESICRHKNCEIVSGRKSDYLYCNDCEERLSDDW